MTKLGFLAAVLASVLLVLAACGGGDDDDDAGEGDDDDAPALTENELAEAILIGIEDLPGAGWTAEPQASDDEEAGPLDDCDRGDPEGTIGEAESDQFARAETETIEASSRIFETEEQLAAATEDFQDIADCVEDLVEDGALDDGDALYSDFKFDEADFAEFGDITKAYRISMLLTEANPPEGADAETVEIFLDMVYIGVENAGVRLLATGIFEPYDAAELETIAGIAEDKIRAGLAGETPDDDEANDEPTDEPEETDRPTSTGGGFSTRAPGSQTSAATGPGSSPEEPIAFGQTGVLLERMQIRVLEVDFDAEAEVLAFNSLNEATPGKNMVLVTVEVTNVGSDSLDVFFDPFWNLIGEKGTAYDEFTPSCGVTADELDGELQPGESRSGNVCVQADEDDSNLVFYVELYTDDFDIVPLYLALQ